MLSITGGRYSSCDGVTRRSFLQAGVLGLAGLTLADVLRLRAPRRPKASPSRTPSVILIWKGGGPSHIDTWDLKPDAPAEYRGEFKPIATNVPGIRDQRASAAVGQADGQVLHPPLGDAPRRRPRVGQPLPADRLQADQRHSLATRCPATARSSPRSAARAVRVCRPTSPCRTPRAAPPPAYLGVAYNPFSVGADPNAANFSVRNLTLPNGISMSRLENRRKLLQVDRHAAPRRRPDRPDGRPRRLHAQGVRDGRQPGRPEGVRHQPGRRRDARPLRPQQPGPEHAAGAAAGRSGRDVRHGQRRRLGHARQQLRGAEEDRNCRSSTRPGRR